MKIITDNAPRALVSLSELPEKDAEDFGYIEEGDRYTPRFVNYKGAWYDVYDTERVVEYMHWAKDWHSFVSESFFSGVLFRFSGEDNVICGRYCV